MADILTQDEIDALLDIADELSTEEELEKCIHEVETQAQIIDGLQAQISENDDTIAKLEAEVTKHKKYIKAIL